MLISAQTVSDGATRTKEQSTPLSAKLNLLKQVSLSALLLPIPLRPVLFISVYSFHLCFCSHFLTLRNTAVKSQPASNKCMSLRVCVRILIVLYVAEPNQKFHQFLYALTALHVISHTSNPSPPECNRDRCHISGGGVLKIPETDNPLKSFRLLHKTDGLRAPTSNLCCTINLTYTLEALLPVCLFQLCS